MRAEELEVHMRGGGVNDRTVGAFKKATSDASKHVKRADRALARQARDTTRPKKLGLEVGRVQLGVGAHVVTGAMMRAKTSIADFCIAMVALVG